MRLCFYAKLSDSSLVCGLHKFNFITMLMPRSNKKSIKKGLNRKLNENMKGFCGAKRAKKAKFPITIFIIVHIRQARQTMETTTERNTTDVVKFYVRLRQICFFRSTLRWCAHRYELMKAYLAIVILIRLWSQSFPDFQHHIVRFGIFITANRPSTEITDFLMA